MNVAELMEHLKTCDPTLEVVLSCDSEGNAYSTLHAWADDMVFVEGEVHYKTLTPDLQKQGYTEEDVYSGDDGVNALVLWP